jgi:long-chain fatty acid transport protein
MGGDISIYPTITHDNADGTTDVSERKFFYPIHFYATYKMNDKLAVGLGVNNPFGLETHWSNTSETSQVATFSHIETTEFNPNIAYKITDKLSIAAGIAYVKLNATLETILPSPPYPPNVDLRISGDGYGWGANAAAHYKATDQLNLGLSYRSKVKINVTGTADAIGLGVSRPASTTITLPDLLQIGSSYNVSDKLTLNADFGYTWWSSYYKLTVNSATVPGGTLTQEKHWKDVWNLRIGGQYKLSDQWKLRAGYLYDQSPVQEEWFDSRVPDSDRQGVSIGAGYAVGNITVDVAYLYLRFNDRTINDSTSDNLTTNPSSLNGTYKSDGHLAGLTIGYKF